MNFKSGFSFGIIWKEALRVKDLLDSEDTGIFLFQNDESELLRKAVGFLVGILNLKHMEEQANI